MAESVKNDTQNTNVSNSTSTKENSVKTKSVTISEAEVKLAYIGPNIAEFGLLSNRIFTGTEKAIRSELAYIVEKYPLVEKMLVEVSTLSQKKDRVKRQGNILNKYYSDLQAIISANKKAKTENV